MKCIHCAHNFFENHEFHRIGQPFTMNVQNIVETSFVYIFTDNSQRFFNESKDMNNVWMVYLTKDKIHYFSQPKVLAESEKYKR